MPREKAVVTYITGELALVKDGELTGLFHMARWEPVENKLSQYRYTGALPPKIRTMKPLDADIYYRH